MKKSAWRVWGMVVAVSLVIGVPPAQAADEDWAFEIAPYLWGFGIDGQFAVGGLPPADVDVSFSDILEDFEGGLALYGMARKGPWVAGLDFSYLDMESTVQLPTTTLKVGNESMFVKGVAGYQVTTDAPVDTDVFAGVRYSQFKTDLNVAGAGSASRTEDWADPLVGLNIAWPFAEHWRANLVADIGGFGVGSDLAWELMPMIQYQVNDVFSVKAAYRWLDIDYDEDDYKADILIHGWLLGLGFAF